MSRMSSDDDSDTFQDAEESVQDDKALFKSEPSNEKHRGLQLSPVETSNSGRRIQARTDNVSLEAPSNVNKIFEKYASSKIQPFLRLSNGLSFLIVSCTYDWFKPLVEKLGATGEGEPMIVDIAKPTRKPRLFRGRLGDEEICILQTPLGEGHTRTYAWGLLICKQKLLGIYHVPELYNRQACFEDTFGLTSDSTFSQAVRGAYVIVGLGDNVLSDQLDKLTLLQRAIQMSGWYSWKDFEQGDHWKAKVFTHQSDSSFKLCILEWHPSFWGEIASFLGTAIVNRNPKGVWHIGCKVGTFVTPMAPLFCPAKYAIVSARGVTRVEKSNIFSLQQPHYGSKLHASVSSPFEEMDKILVLVEAQATIKWQRIQFYQLKL